jgi:predicted amidohydrolase YtcJ
VLPSFFIGMTIDPAYASFSDHIFGSLEPGKRADFVILSKNIMTIEPKEVLETQILATVLDGEEVYGGLELPRARGRWGSRHGCRGSRK